MNLESLRSCINRILEILEVTRHPNYQWVVPVLFLCLFMTFMGTANAKTLSYSIQIGAYVDRRYAEDELKNLRKFEKDAFYRRERTKDNRMLYKVYVGSYTSKEDARREARRLKEQQIISDYLLKRLEGRIDRISDRKIEEPNGRPEVLNPAVIETGLISKGGDTPGKTPEKMIEEEALPLAIENVTFAVEKGIEEKVFIHSNRYFRPVVYFSIREENPKLTVEIKNTMTFPKGFSKIPLKGEWIEQVRIQDDPASKTLEVILDLQAAENYDVTQSFNRTENIYAIEVVKKDEATESTPSNQRPLRQN